MKITFNLGHNGDVSLTYRLFDNSFTRRFYARFNEQENAVHDRNLFYNFGDTIEDAEHSLNQVVKDINEMQPGLIENQSDLNRLHEAFPDMEANASGEMKKLLCRFNDAIHRLEDKHHTAAPHWIALCDNDSGAPLEDEDYKLFTLSRKWGHLYMNYPHVGKHFAEMAGDNDVDIPKEHIQLTSIMRNNFFAWFGFDSDLAWEAARLKQCEEFYPKIEHKIPFKWGDPRLAIGYLPLGVLETNLSRGSIFRMIHNHMYLNNWVLH